MDNANREGADLPAPDKEGMGTEQPLTFDEAILLRTKQLEERYAKPKPVEEPAPDEGGESEEEGEPAEDLSIAEEPESEPADNDVLSKFDLENLSEQELDALGKAVKSKVPKRFGELTKRAKSAEERAAQLEARLAEASQTKKNPLEVEKPVENNPFSDIETIEGLRAQSEQFVRITEWAEDLLEEHDRADPDDVITEQDGKPLTKREVRSYMKKARQAREKFLPARLVEIQQHEQSKQVQVALQEKAKTELPWFASEDDDTRKEYELVINDPRVKLIRERVPEVAAQLDYLFAHAVNSMSQTLKAKNTKKEAKPKRLDPPSNPTGAVTRGTEREGAPIARELKELTTRLESTRSYDDFAKLRAMQRLRKTV